MQRLLFVVYATQFAQICILLSAFVIEKVKTLPEVRAKICWNNCSAGISKAKKVQFRSVRTSTICQTLLILMKLSLAVILIEIVR